MLKRINWKAVFKCFAWLICLAGTITLMGFIEIKKETVKCSKIEILIPGADNFIEIEEIDAILKQTQGNLIGRRLDQINLHHIEKSIAANPYIGFVKVYAEMDGTMMIEVRQRQPVLRILNAGGQDYYVDSEGLKIPVSPNFTANVLVASGQILEGFNGRVDTLMTSVAKDLYKTAVYIKNDPLWDAQIEQLFINAKSDIEMVPRVGNQRIILGNAKGVDIKLGNLLAFYKQAMPKVGWNAYSTINLKYLNQIVCEKRDSTTIKKLDKGILPDSVAKQQQEVANAVEREITAAIKEDVKAATTATEKEIKKTVSVVDAKQQTKKNNDSITQKKQVVKTNTQEKGNTNNKR